MEKNSQAVIPDNIIVVEGDGLNPVPTPEAGDAGKVLGVLNSSGDIGWVEDQSGTLTQIQSDWAENDSSKVSYIEHKPDLSVYATTSAVNTALAGKQDTISDLSTIRSGASAGATAVQPATLESYATTSAMNTALADKQDVISDLSDIRSGAALGATSVQPSQLPSSDELVPSATSGDAGKILSVDASGNPEWITPSGGTTYSAGDGIAIDGSNVISADVDGVTIGIDSTTKKIKLLSTIPSVDQTYSASSTNAQSGTAVAQAISSASYTAGDGIDITNHAVSANWATGLKIDSGSMSINETIGRATSSSSGEFFTLNSDMCAAIDGSGLTFTKKASIYIGTNVYWAVIPKSSASYYGVLNYLIFGSAVNVNDNPTITLLSSNINSGSSTITWSTVKANPSNYCVVCLGTWSEGFRVITFSVSSSDKSTGTIAYTKTFVDAICVVNPLPTSTSADRHKFLIVNNQGSAEWDNLVAGNGLKQSSNVYSVIAGNGISFADTQEQNTLTLQGIPNGSGSGTYPTGKISIIGLLNDELVDAIEAGPITIDLKFNEWSNGSTDYKLSIIEWNASSSLPNISNTIRSTVDTAASVGTYTFDLSNTTTTGGLTFSAVKANPQGFALTFINNQWNEYVIGTNIYSAPVNTGLTTITSVLHNAVTVTNPLPTSAQADSGKVLKVNASGNAEWGTDGFTTTAGVTDIQVVNALPASPVATVLYLVPET